ncbi:MAG TPA: hypothetical protein VFP50_14500 [Anaeromyxobacteraceae bacterium]|nr:hypothetical protein [Anaeromyxobacteraceae bacterium]
MRTRPIIAVTALAALALALAPAAARAEEAGWSLTAQVWGGVSRYDSKGLRDGLQTQGKDVLQSSMNTKGVSALLRLSALDLGVLYEGRWLANRTDSAVLTPVVGFAVDLNQYLRLDLLGELGGHQVSNVTISSGGADFSQTKSAWLPFIGARPTLTLRLPVGPVHAVASLAPFARWDLIKKTVTLSSTSTTTTAPSYELGGTTFGIAVGAGIEL